jgi:hypothetical protein
MVLKKNQSRSYLNHLVPTMHGPINVKSPNNTSKWQMGFNSAFKWLIPLCHGRLIGLHVHGVLSVGHDSRSVCSNNTKQGKVERVRMSYSFENQHYENLAKQDKFYQTVEVSATSWSLVQRSPTDCGASLCVIQKPQEWGAHDPRWVASPQKKNPF